MKEQEFGQFTSIPHLAPPKGSHPRLQALHEAWLNAPKIDGVAHRRSVGFEEVRDAIGQSGIVDVLSEGEFRYRLFGSALVAALGYDATGQRTVDLRPPDYATMVTSQYAEVIALRQPIVHEIRSVLKGEREPSYFRFTAPLTLETGTIDQLWMTVSMLGTFGRDVFSSETGPVLPLRD